MRVCVSNCCSSCPVDVVRIIAMAVGSGEVTERGNAEHAVL
jgi:hypothetical protein